jgi:hypothetical protein
MSSAGSGVPGGGGKNAASKRPSSSITTAPFGKTNSAEQPAKVTISSTRSRRPSGSAEGVQKQAEAERLAAVDAVQKKLLGYDGHCWCCLMPNCTHEPGSPECPEALSVKPDMSAFSEIAPPSTRGNRAAAGRRGRAQLPLSMSDDEKAERRKKYKAVHQRELARLVAEAKERCVAHITRLKEPIAGSGPLGAFTFYEKVAVDFAMSLDMHLTSEQLSRSPRCSACNCVPPPSLKRVPALVSVAPRPSRCAPRVLSLSSRSLSCSSVNRAALQKFAQQIKAAGLASLVAVRTPEEATITDFVSLRRRLQSNDSRAATVRSFIAACRDEELIKYGSIGEVQALGSPTLLTITAAVRAAAAPRMGRPQKGRAGDGPGYDIAIAENWVDGHGGYTVGSMVKRAMYDVRRINISQKMTQADVLDGSALSEPEPLVCMSLKSCVSLLVFVFGFRPIVTRIAHEHTCVRNKDPVDTIGRGPRPSVGEGREHL